MGFGLCSFGFLCTVAEGYGVDVLGYVLMAYGFWRVGTELKNNKGYMIAAYAAAVSAVPAAVSVYQVIAAEASLPAVPSRLVIAKGITGVLCLVVICFAYCGETAKIASEGGAKVFALRAKVTMYLSVLFAVLVITGSFSGISGSVVATVIIGKIVIPLINALTLLACFTTITTEARKVHEDEIIEEETEKLVRKRMKDLGKDKEGKE